LLRRRSVDLTIIIFLVSAFSGTLVAYQKPDAQTRFLMLAGAAAAYVLITHIPPGRFWNGVRVVELAILGLSLSVFILRLWPGGEPSFRTADLARVVHRHGLGLDSGVISGWIAVLFPISIAHLDLVGRLHQQFRPLSLLVLAVGLVALVLGGSTSALLAFILIFGVNSLGWKKQAPRRSRLAVVMLLVPAILLGTWFSTDSSVWQRMVAEVASRWDLALEGWALFTDFPITGTGLGSFPGIYAGYIRELPVFYYGSSQNLYLDVAIEQGVVGLAALMVLLLTSLSLLLRKEGAVWTRVQGGRELRWAIICSLLTIIVLGFMDDAFYAGAGGFMLFVVPGCAVALAKEIDAKASANLHPPRRQGRYVAGTVLVAALAVIITNWSSLVSRAYSNLGALRMAQIELQNWPRDRWFIFLVDPRLSDPQDAFKRSLAFDPNNRTAEHRLGMLAISNLDFQEARLHLETAFQIDPWHRGVRKALGFVYAWQGETVLAEAMLKDIPEAQQELKGYAIWWIRRGEPQFADLSSETIAVLGVP